MVILLLQFVTATLAASSPMDEALRALLVAVHHVPDEGAFHHSAAVIARQSDRTALVAPGFRAAQALDPIMLPAPPEATLSAADGLYNAAVAMAKRPRGHGLAEAIRFSRRALAVADAAPHRDASLYLGHFLSRAQDAYGRGRREEEVAAFRACHATAVSAGWARDAGTCAFRLGDALGNGFGRWDEAVVAGRASVAADARDAYHHHKLGFSLASVGRYDEGLVSYTRAHAIDPARFPELACGDAARCKFDRSAEFSGAADAMADPPTTTTTTPADGKRRLLRAPDDGGLPRWPRQSDARRRRDRALREAIASQRVRLHFEDPKQAPHGFRPDDAHLRTCTSCAQTARYRASIAAAKGGARAAVLDRGYLLVDDAHLVAWRGVVLALGAATKHDVPVLTRRGPASLDNFGMYGSALYNRATSTFEMVLGEDTPVYTSSSDGLAFREPVAANFAAHSHCINTLGSAGTGGRELLVLGHDCSPRLSWRLGTTGFSTCIATGRRWAGAPVLRDVLWRAAGGGPCGAPCRSASDAYNCVTAVDEEKQGNGTTTILRLVNRAIFGTRRGWREIRGVRVSELRVHGAADDADAGDKLEQALRDGHRTGWREKQNWYLDTLGNSERYQQQVYALTSRPLPGTAAPLHVGLATVIAFPKLHDEARPPYSHDVINTFLTTSRDGETFDLGWVYAGEAAGALVARGAPGAFDHGIAFPASGLVTPPADAPGGVGDFHWLYYEGRGDARHEERASVPAAIGLVRYRRHRLAGLRRDPDGGGDGARRCGTATTRDFELSDRWTRLTLNFVASAPGASVSVAVLDAATRVPLRGRGRKDMVPVSAIDSADAQVTWRRHGSGSGREAAALLPAAVEVVAVALQFWICEDAQLFSFTFSGG